MTAFIDWKLPWSAHLLSLYLHDLTATGDTQLGRRRNIMGNIFIDFTDRVIR